MTDEPKIFIDEDWKAQVEREKAQAATMKPEAAPETVTEVDPNEGAMPEASMDTLVASLATQAMLALGLIASRGQEQVVIDLDSAKYAIDMLRLLRDKTKGNLTPKEEGALLQAVAEMEEVYVLRMQQYQEHALQQAGIDPRQLKSK